MNTVNLDSNEVPKHLAPPACIHQQAIVTVPQQQWEAPYEPSMGLKEGTIFPSLNMPFFAAENKLGGGNHD